MDLICICNPEGSDIHQVLYVQCKSGKKRVPYTQFIGLVEHAKRYGGQAVLATKDEKGHIVIEYLF